MDSADYLYGVDLYNHGYWWEAHESWEGLWQLTDKSGVQGQFLQGLIQCSACHLKWHMHQLDGVERLRASSSTYLQFVIARSETSRYMGLDVLQYLLNFEGYYQRLLRYGAGDEGHDPAIYPYVVLERA
jgi:predicted metal-dependent hydrolase